MNNQRTVTSQELEKTLALIKALTEENEALKLEASKPKANGSGLKVSVKGAISIYGYGKFPITVYKDTMLKILDRGDEIRAFIKANDDKLARKEV